MFGLEIIIFSILLLILLFPSLQYMRKQLRIKECLKNLPGPKPVFFFGNAQEGMLEVFIRFYKDHGRIVKGRFGPIHHGLLVSDYNFMKKFLLGNKNLSKGRGYDITKGWLGNGLLTSEENDWRLQRKILAPAFSSNLLIDFIAIFDTKSNTLVEKLKEKIQMESINIHEFLSLCSLDIICETTMGISVNAQEKYGDYVRCIKDMCNIFARRMMSLWKNVDTLFIFSTDYYWQKRCLKMIHTCTKNIITARKQQRLEMGTSRKVSDPDDVGSKRKLALLDILLENSESRGMSEKEVEEQVHTFMFAGHDTVTAAMDFLIYEFSKNPDIQELAFQEQESLFGTDLRGEIKFKDIQEMKYLEAVIKETLRLYPPVPLIGRLVSEDFEFENHLIPEGTLILFMLYALHRDPELFPNPDNFDPSRFENSKSVDPFSFIPFSTGPRNCIGQKFAMYEMKVIMSKLIRNFKFLPADPPHTLNLQSEIVLTSKNGVKIKLSHRN